MTAIHRRAADHAVPILAIVLAAALAACTSGSVGGPAPTPSGGSSFAVGPSLTAVPGGRASPVVGATVGPPTTTSVAAFGTIDDALPPSFPKLAGQEPADPGAGATSGSFVLNTTATRASQAMKSALFVDEWIVDVGSPLEDGTIVLEATHAPPGCKVEVRFTPVSGSVMMSVLYGAACPFR